MVMDETTAENEQSEVREVKQTGNIPASPMVAPSFRRTISFPDENEKCHSLDMPYT